MVIGVPREIKSEEYRVGMVPAGVRTIVEAGGKVLVQAGAGLGSGIQDSEYKAVGALIVDSAKEVWKQSKVIIKVKEPISQEYNLIEPEQVLYTYLHLAVFPELARVLQEKRVTSIGYETIQKPDGSLPLLKPMSEVAGKMAVQIGAAYLQKENGGKGILLGGVPGIRRGKVTIIGGGVVGTNACKVAIGLGAEVTVIDVNVDRLEYLDDIFRGGISTLKSVSQNIEESVTKSDLVVGAVLIAGAKAPTLVTRDMISKMKKGSVIVDVAVDQGGCVETCKPTTHAQPTYIVDGVIHYCVANMPGTVAQSSTYALTNATISYLKKFVELGIEKTLQKDSVLALGVNTFGGKIIHPAVAKALNQSHTQLSKILGVR